MRPRDPLAGRGDAGGGPRHRVPRRVVARLVRPRHAAPPALRRRRDAGRLGAADAGPAGDRAALFLRALRNAARPADTRAGRDVSPAALRRLLRRARPDGRRPAAARGRPGVAPETGELAARRGPGQRTRCRGHPREPRARHELPVPRPGSRWGPRRSTSSGRGPTTCSCSRSWCSWSSGCSRASPMRPADARPARARLPAAPCAGPRSTAATTPPRCTPTPRCRATRSSSTRWTAGWTVWNLLLDPAGGSRHAGGLTASSRWSCRSPLTSFHATSRNVTSAAGSGRLRSRAARGASEARR